MKPAMTAQQKEFTESASGLALYRSLAVGPHSIFHFVYVESAQLIAGNLSGLVGFGLRACLYPRMFRACGQRPAIGKNSIIRRPKQISIGNKLLLDDNAVLDVRGDLGRIEIADYVSIGRASQVVAKEGIISLGNGVNVGSNVRIATQSKVSVGNSVLIAAYAYIGPGDHQFGDSSAALIEKEMRTKGGVSIGEHAWIGTRATIVDGVTIGKHAIVGAHSLVKEDVPDYTIVAGVPAKPIGEVPKDS